jgi:hypothetical protein
MSAWAGADARVEKSTSTDRMSPDCAFVIGDDRSSIRVATDINRAARRTPDAFIAWLPGICVPRMKDTAGGSRDDAIFRAATICRLESPLA